MRDTLDELSVGLIVLTEEGVISFANRFCRENKIVSKNWKGKKYYEAIRSLELIGFARELLEGRSESIEFGHSGRFYRATPLGSFAFQIEDITEPLRFEKLQKEFIATVSHELSTPLTAVKGLIETALFQDTPSRELLERALKRVGDLEKLISSLRFLILSDTPQRLTKARFLINDLVKDIIEDLKEEVDRKNIRVELTEEKVEIESDREKLYALLKNLIENAVRYNREGGKVSVRIERVEHGIKILVEDTGEGIPKEDIPLLFQPFFGGKNRKGMGLGLAISKRIADFLGAELTLKSERGKGTTAEVSLP